MNKYEEAGLIFARSLVASKEAVIIMAKNQVEHGDGLLFDLQDACNEYDKAIQKALQKATK